MNVEVHKLNVKRHLSLALVIHASCFILACSCMAQEIRRAVPVDQSQDSVPVERAIPLEPFESPAPRRPAATPAPRPVSTPAPRPQATPPVMREDTLPAPAPPAPASSETADEVQLDFANSYYGHNQFDLAAPEYERYLNLYPNAPGPDRESAFFRLGESYRKTGSLNAAKNAYESLLLNFGNGIFIGPAAYRLADMAYAAKDYDAALNYYRKASVRLTDPAVALSAKYYSARCLEALNLPSEARITYEDIVQTKGDNPYREQSRLALAEILSKFDRKPEALEQFEALAKEAQQPAVKVQAYVKAGLLNIELNQPDKGAADLNKALAIPEIGEWKPVAQIGLLRVLYETGKYKELLDQYEAAFTDLPPDIKPEVLVLAANSKRQLGDAAGASTLYEQIMKDYPSSVYADEAKYENLVSLYDAGDPNVIAAADAFLAGNPDPAKRDQVILLKAESLFKAHKYADAAPVYASLKDSTDLGSAYRSEVLFKLGWCYMQNNDPGQAITALTGFLKDYPLDKRVPAALAQRAIAYQQSKDLPSALKDFDQLLNDYPKAKERELALQQKALILGQQQDNAGMSAAFKRLLEEYPHTSAAAQANYWIGSAAFSAKDYKACIAPLDAARKLDKAQFFERATVRIIAAYYTLGDRDSLASEVDLYNGSNPKDKIQPEVLRSLGKSYLDAKDFASAQKYLILLAARDEVTPDDWFNLGRAQLGAKQYPDAIASLQKYIDSQHDPVAKGKGLLALGQAQLQSGKLDDAQASADQACSLQPEGLPNAQGRMLSGDIQIARGNFEDAAKIFQGIAVIIDDPQVTPAALEKAYHCLDRLGDTAAASKVLNELQTKYPEYQVKADRLLAK